jgi:hypothetical protein
MNIAFLAPGILQMRGGETTNIYNFSYFILGADRTTKQPKALKKPQMNADELRSISSAQNPQNRTRMTRIARIFTDTSYQCNMYPFVSGKRYFLFSSGLKNHKEHRAHREKLQRSVLSVYSVVEKLCSNSLFQEKLKNYKVSGKTRYEQY